MEISLSFLGNLQKKTQSQSLNKLNTSNKSRFVPMSLLEAAGTTMMNEHNSFPCC
ncbi:hypothetical protein [Paranoxybacillus vitaminiphilus]|uniref:hypothetical protein n=1 Tax=Paranoxybacillus vitaminiphilus TaxID=581036 RepID=UPI0015EBD86B|nr:hypothetical protein [Anoxybacillus vitaminiphilus]